eukprot:GHRR01032827.1.p1 GENE.GHRR01032827.1~~GHRR01032827.1.p1  ORF type:complete len:282 (+),score=59.83 GHRR01032827.1:415-1260(+)
MRSRAGQLSSKLVNLLRQYSPGKLSTKRLGLKNVENVVAVASGKGGVGKSTVAANLAAALAVHHGWRVGLLDADIHGPSLPTMMNLHGEPAASEEGLMHPLENHRVKCMSMGFFLKGDAPVVWRGPMTNSAVDRFLMGTAWGKLNVLVVDMPPGTGDAQINLSQRLPLSGAVIVSTPQDVALLDARRGAQMFRKVHVPLLGLVENMSYYCCPNCGHKDAVFGSGGGAATAQELGIGLLGQEPADAAACRSRWRAKCVCSLTWVCLSCLQPRTALQERPTCR